MKKILTKTKSKKNTDPTEQVSHNKFWIPASLVIAGFLFMYAGIYRGEMAVVLRKAINICLECIGIG